MLSEPTISVGADQLLLATAALGQPGRDAPLESLPGHLEALAEALRTAESAHRCDEARRTVEALLRTSQRTGAS